MPYQEPIDCIMTGAVHSIKSEQTVEDAQWLRLAFGIHHLQVTHQEQLVGIPTTTDILRHRIATELLIFAAPISAIATPVCSMKENSRTSGLSGNSRLRIARWHSGSRPSSSCSD